MLGLGRAAVDEIGRVAASAVVNALAPTPSRRNFVPVDWQKFASC
jgi:hypothetical protein